MSSVPLGLLRRQRSLCRAEIHPIDQDLARDARLSKARGSPSSGEAESTCSSDDNDFHVLPDIAAEQKLHKRGVEGRVFELHLAAQHL